MTENPDEMNQLQNDYSMYFSDLNEILSGTTTTFPTTMTTKPPTNDCA